MKYLFLTSLIVTGLTGSPASSQEDSVRGALLGNDPRATLTTGIGQAVQPIGIPVVSTPNAAPAAPSTAPPTKFGATKIEGRYELGEVQQKKGKGMKETGTSFTNRSVSTGPGEKIQTDYVHSSYAGGGGELLPPAGKGRSQRVPRGPLPQVKRIPYTSSPTP